MAQRCRSVNAQVPSTGLLRSGPAGGGSRRPRGVGVPTLEIRLLGPVEVAAAGRLLDLGPPQRRAVLAALAVDAGRPVPVDVLIDRVWDQPPPAQARSAVRVHLTRLRQILRESRSAAPELLRRAGGYVLDPGPAEVDLLRFRRLAGAVREPDHSEPDRFRSLTGALGLWRGPVLADVGTQWAARVRETCDRERLDAAVAWARAGIRLGRHDEVITAVRALIGSYPLAEPLVVTLMQALVGTGRTAEALDAFTVIRTALADGLGVEPAPELRALHLAILRDQTGGGPPPATEPVPGPPAPAQLPADVRGFTGRTDPLSTLDALLAATRNGSRAPLIGAISGPAGAGKTALAVHWAHRVAAGFPDGQLYVDLRGFDPGAPVLPADALTRFLAALGFAGPVPSDLDDLAACFRTEVAHRRLLILLDNAPSAAHVRPLLPGTASCVVLVTSRDSLGGLIAVHGAHRIDLGLLRLPEATSLLRLLVGNRADADLAALTALAHACARLPLALRIAAEVAQARSGTPLATLVAELTDTAGLDLLDAGDDPHAAVTAVFSWSMRRLPPETATLFRLLGLHPGPDLDAPAAAALAGTGIEPARRGLDALARANLIHSTSPERFGMHDLLRAYARRLVATDEPESLRDTAGRRLHAYYLATAAWAMNRLRPADARHRPAAPASPIAPGLADLASARRWLDRERPVLVALAAQTPSLSGILFHYLDGGHFADALVLHDAARVAAGRAGDPLAEANALRGLGSANMWLGRLDLAGDQLRRALALFEESGDRAGQARTELSLGLLARRLGRAPDSDRHFERSLLLSREDADPAGEARALTNLGIAAAARDQPAEAARRLRQALGLCRAAGDEFGEAFTLTNLGLVEQKLGAVDAATGHHQRAVELFRRLGNRHGEAHTLDNLGWLQLSSGSRAAAVTIFQEALALFRALGDRAAQRHTQAGLAQACRELTDPAALPEQHPPPRL